MPNASRAVSGSCFRRASRFFERGRYTTAARMLVELAEVTPGNLTVRMMLAQSYYYTAQLSRAEAELRTVLDADPSRPQAHLLLGRILERSDRPAEAVRHLQHADTMSAWDLLSVA